MNDSDWTRLHDQYKDRDWSNRPSMFAEFVAAYFKSSGTILELGAGLGQDAVYFTSLGFTVTATDLNISSLQSIDNPGFNVAALDMRKPFMYDNESFDTVYAHLSLHYFDRSTTQTIFREIYRVLKPGGILAYFANSKDDPEYMSGTKLEEDFFDINGVTKRYFDVYTAQEFAGAFETLLTDNHGETYKDIDKGVHHLIRYVGRKV